MIVLIDAHHHVWRVNRGDYGWLTPDLLICRDYGLEDLRPLLGDIGGTILVQAAPTEAETTFMLDVARESEGLIRGVVGWADFAAADAPDRIAAAATEPLLKGLRPMLQDIVDADWILRPAIESALRALAAYGLRFDALIQPRHVRVILQLAHAHPELPIAIDHGAKPDIAHGAFEPWATEMALLARETPAVCKLSGLVTEAGPGWTVEDLRPYVEHLLRIFGPKRLMWGSDWPVVNLAGGYTRWRDAALVLLSGLSGSEKEAILGGTARRFYGLSCDR